MRNGGWDRSPSSLSHGATIDLYCFRLDLLVAINMLNRACHASVGALLKKNNAPYVKLYFNYSCREEELGE